MYRGQRDDDSLRGRRLITNPGRVPLVMIEVQCGDYVGEDDIVRFEDVYGRIAESK